MHNLPPMLGQNEFYFDPTLADNYIGWLSSSPEYLINAFFSLWGHYGVDLFIFVSAYGCAISYQKTKKSYLLFLKPKFTKVYFSFVICLFVYIVLGLLKQQFVTEKVLFWDAILWKLLLISNFIQGQEITPVGPWWFLPFIFQFYLLFPLLLRGFNKYGNTALIVTSISGYVIEASGVWSAINFSPLGHLPLICLGMYLAGKKSVSIPYWLVALSVLFFTLGHYNFYFWLIADLSVVVIIFCLFKFLLNMPSTAMSIKLLALLGGISLHLFLVNGFLRSPFKSIALSLDSWWGDVVAALLSLMFSLAFAYVLKWFEGYIRLFTSQIVARNTNKV